MPNTLTRTVPLALALVCAATVPANAETSSVADQKEVAVTVYNDNLGLVREVRVLKLGAGVRELEFGDVASAIDPTSVSLRSLTAPQGLSVLEQNYEYDLLTPQKLLDKYVGRDIEIKRGETVMKAMLLSTQEGQVYKIGDRIYLSPPGEVILPKVPDNLVARPTLKWMLKNDSTAPEQRTEVSYLTHGMSWKADYVLVLGADPAHSTLNGWVTLDNQTGAAYANAKLTLVAGDVNRVRREVPMEYEMARAAKVADAPAGFAERALFEYHSYTLQRPTTLKDHQSKQISLLSAGDVPTRRVYRFETSSYPIWLQNAERRSGKITVYTDVRNDKVSHLGMPLPKGTVRVYQQDADKALQFVGEDSIDHTPKDETLHIKVGQAFDLVGEQRQTTYRVLGDRLVESTYEIVLRNHKDEPVTIVTPQTLGGDWEIGAHSHPFVKTSATSVEFPVKVMPNKEERITYTVRTRY